MSMVDITGLSKASVLLALFSGAKKLVEEDALLTEEMTLEHAQLLTGHTPKFAYLGFRALHVDLSGDQFDPSFYDMANAGEGENLAETVISELRKDLS